MRRLVLGHRDGNENVFAKRIGGRVAGDGELVGAVADRHPLRLEGGAAVEREIGEETDLRRELVIDARHQRLFARNLRERALVAAPDAGSEVEIVAAGVGEQAGVAGGDGRGGGGAGGNVREARAERLAGGLEREGLGLRVSEAVYGGVIEDDIGRGSAGEGCGVGVEGGGCVGHGAIEVVDEEWAVLHAEGFSIAVAAAKGDVSLGAKGEAVDGVDGADRGVGIERVLVGGADLAASVAAFENDVDHASDGGAAVDGRGTAGKNLDAVDGGERNAVDVGLEGGAPVGEIGGPHAVNEDERLRGTEAPQVDGAGGAHL